MPATTKPSGIEATILFSRFYDRIKVFYEAPENKRRFNEWQQKREEEGTARNGSSRDRAERLLQKKG